MALPSILRFKDLQQRGIVKSRAQLENLKKKYGFPLGRWMSPNCRVWFEDEVVSWIESRPIATENKRLVITEKHVSRRNRKSAEAAA